VTGCHTFPADVTDSSQVRSAIGGINATLGVPDVLVNNAGIHTGFGPFWEIPEDEWNADLNVNLLGLQNVSRVVAADMVRRGSGRIINLVGGGFNRASKHMSAYAVSKTAVMRLTEIMALELEPHGVSAFALSPGLVDTPGNRAKVARSVVREWSTLAEILETHSVPADRAAGVALALASGRFDGLTGRVFYAHGDLEKIQSATERILDEDARRLAVAR
jgi:NAD(P)-dependent dehydrogenase (short-subunit alcohol dehydrogenase family)